MNTLSQTIDSELLCLDLPIFTNSSSFPLQHLFLEYHNLNTDLEKVKSKGALVTAMKASIKSQLDIVNGKQKLQLNKVEQTGVKHSTGKDKGYGSFFCLHSNIIDRFFEPILVGVDPIHQLSIVLVIAC